MSLRKHRLSNLTIRLVLLSLAAFSLAVLRPGRARTRALQPRKRRSGLRRAAVSLSFATLFFAGAAFSAGAGDLLVQAVENQHSAASAPDASVQDAECRSSRQSDWDAEDSTDGCAEQVEAAEGAEQAVGEAAVETPAAPAAEAAPETAPEAAPETASPESASPSTTAAIAEAAGNVASSVSHAEQGQSRSHAPSLGNAVRNRVKRVARRDPAPAVIEAQSADRTHKHEVHPDPEVELPGMAATIWLHRALPDPTPPSKRLTKPFARNLRYASARHKVHWSLVLGVLRARGERGSVPATKRGLNRLAKNLSRLGARKDEWNAALALEGRTAFADRTVALAHYHRAVGLKALVRGLRWARPLLAKRLLNDMRVSIYPGGREDVRSGKTDVRVIVLIRYLAEAHGQVTVSSLTSGHGVYSRPGVVSAHTYGQAVDIAALEGKSIIGNQEPGGLTEMAVRNMLLLPAELRPNQLISLLGLGGPSFPMGNHDDHIHAGF
ncbi:MAG TPA: hypothetical protein VGW30_00085 [Gaiellaceae bacterium]|nr:hypothetical protein [Gaiellaceae bacterium]